MEERTGADFPTTGSNTSGLSRLESAESADRQYAGQPEGSEQQRWTEGAEGGFKEKVGARAHAYSETGKRWGGAARTQAFKQIDNKKSQFANELGNFASTLEEVSRTLEKRGNKSQQQLVDKGARYVRQASEMLRNRSTEELFGQAQGLLRERPAVAAAGALALGFLGVRLFRS